MNPILQKQLAGSGAILRRVNVTKGGDVVKQLKVEETPTIWVYDSTGKLKLKTNTDIPSILKIVRSKKK